MKHLILLSSIFLTSSILAEELSVHGKITKVTLYRDRAEVTRRAEVELKPGRTTLLFGAVPQDVQTESLKVVGTGSAGTMIEGANIRTHTGTEDTSPAGRSLRDKITAVEEQISSVEKGTERLNGQRQIILGLQLDGAAMAQQKETRLRTPQEVGELYKFVSSSLAAVDESLLELAKRHKNLQKEKMVLEAELQKLSSGSTTRTEVGVDVTSERPGSAVVDLTYQVSAGSWTPEYALDVRTDEVVPKLLLQSFAVVQQRTGEDWSDVKLSFSTARATFNLTRPDPSPQYLNVYEPREQSRSKDAADFAESDNMEAAGAPVPMGGGRSFMKQQEAEVSGKDILTFDVPGTVTVLANGESRKVKLFEKQLIGKIWNVTTPALSPDVFIEAQVQNSTDTPLLPGALSLLRSGSFVGRTQLGYLAPSEKAQYALGVSDAFRVRRVIEKDFEEDPGILRSFRRLVRNHRVEIENLQKKGETLVVLEGKPVSQNEKIKVEYPILEPKPLDEKDTNRFQSAPDVWEWQLSLKPGEKRELRWGSTIEFSKDLQVSGL